MLHNLPWEEEREASLGQGEKRVSNGKALRLDSRVSGGDFSREGILGGEEVISLYSMLRSGNTVRDLAGRQKCSLGDEDFGNNNKNY